MSPDTNLILITKINSKWLIDLNVKHKTIKYLQDKIGASLDDLRYGNNDLGITPRAYYIKEIIDKLNFIKIQNSWSGKTLLRE